MALLIVAFFAGMLTVLAPCILPLLPVVVGSSASGRSRATPYIVVASLGASIILFTYLLKASTALIAIPPSAWTYLSGGILVAFGFTLAFPALWERVPGIARLSRQGNQLVGAGYQKRSVWGDILIGAGLGPVFSTCSPTYFVILASVLPASFFLGTLYLLAYVLGLSLVLLLIALLGERLSARLGALSDSRGYFKRGLGVLFIALGVGIATGAVKDLETAILEQGFFDVTKIEQRLLERIEPSKEPAPATGTPYIEIKNPSGFLNAEPFALAELVGTQVILIDFMTYSCINCQRTFPYLAAWHEAYADAGLAIVGIHTPEFAFERDPANVAAALAEFGLSFPVVLDNEYATWRAYGNRFWPRKYLIDINGNIVYNHIGEGSYEETELKIRELLLERAARLGVPANIGMDLAASRISGVPSRAQSPETYFGASRNTTLANGTPGTPGVARFTLPPTLAENALYLSGEWDIAPEFARGGLGSGVQFRYHAKNVFLVARSDAGATIEISDGTGAAAKTLMIGESRLYRLVEHGEPVQGTLKLRVIEGDAEFYTFTFG